MKTVSPFFSSLFLRIKNFVQPYWTRFVHWLRHFNPDKHTRTGAMRGLLVIAVFLAGYMGWHRYKWGYGQWIDLIIAIAAVLLIAILASLIFYLLLGLVKQLHRRFTSIVLGILFSVGFVLELEGSPIAVIPLGLMLLSAFIGGSIAVMLHPGFRSTTVIKKILISLLLVVSAGAIGAFVYWFNLTGTEEKALKVDLSEAPDFPVLDLSDPSLDGSFPVRSLTYGHGDDRRPEFGEKADLITPTVNGRPFVGQLDGWKGKLRNHYWGFDRSVLPLNGRVWYPEGEGPFPLVLIVHGNHNMRDYSDPGYEYLGQFLASKGYILVSVDQNFINGDWTKNYNKENDARGWLLLEHLKVWRDWNSEDGHPFFQKVDLDNISLMGHSRGGEAVCVAAAFNKLDHYPDDARVKFDYHFNIRSIVSIAQVDGQYLPSFRPTPLENINFLLLHGSHDADVSSFSGDKQYKRISFSKDGYFFKTSIYIYRANHGQFNTVWGDSDSGPPYKNLLNRKVLIPGEDQRKIGKVYICAFLDLTLKGKNDYLPLFKDYRYGANWLPATYYINRFADSKTTFIADYDEDIDVTTITLPNGKAEADNLTDWKEKDIANRSGNNRRLNQAAYLGWNYEKEEEKTKGESQKPKGEAKRNSLLNSASAVPENQPEDEEKIAEDSLTIQDTAKYTLQLPPGWATGWPIDSGSVFTFAVAQVQEGPSEPLELEKTDKELKEEEEKEEKQKKERRAKDEDTSPQEPGLPKQEDQGVAETEGDPDNKQSSDKSADDEEKPLFFTIILKDSLGHTIRLNLKDYAMVLPPFKAKFTRVKQFEKRYDKASEPILQTFSIPLGEVKKKEPAFNIQQITQISFQFDQARKGVIYLDEIGFRN